MADKKVVKVTELLKKGLEKKESFKPKEGEWEKVGEVGVDAGLMWVGDPCYFWPQDGKPTAHVAKVGTWGDFCDALGERKGPTVQQFNYAMGHTGFGVAVSSGIGDGCYDVFVKKRVTEGWGERITELKVVFIGPEE